MGRWNCFKCILTRKSLKIKISSSKDTWSKGASFQNFITSTDILNNKHFIRRNCNDIFANESAVELQIIMKIKWRRNISPRLRGSYFLNRAFVSCSLPLWTWSKTHLLMVSPPVKCFCDFLIDFCETTRPPSTSVSKFNRSLISWATLAEKLIIKIKPITGIICLWTYFGKLMCSRRGINAFQLF